jgi:HD-GYP domain-containing protein (c-di-GMP phosphodiesterase class II)
MSATRSEQLEREMIRIGKTLVSQLFVLLKTAQHYDEGHSAINHPVSNIMKTVREVHRRSEEASVRLHAGHLLLGETRLKPDAAGFEAFMHVMGEMKRYLIGGINFTPHAKAEEIARFAYTFRMVDPIPSPQTYQKFIELMTKRGIVGIELEILAEEEGYEGDFAELEDSRARAKRVHLQTIHAASEVMESAKIGQTLRLRKAKRVVQGMIDLLLSAETNLIGLTTMRCHDKYTYNHSVNVCILSLAIGQLIGLSKSKLCELGMSALFHDIGKADIPLDILNKPTEFTKEEWETMQRHPVLGVEKLLTLKGLDALCARIITGAFEHHLNYDYSGYPKVPYKNLSLFGRIISIADCYDGLTSSRVYSRVPYTPEKALRFMVQRAGKAYDPILLKLFINCIGVYPVGTLLLLTSKELAVVIENHKNPERWSTPRVRIIADANGKEINGEVMVDLSEPESFRAIVKPLDPRQYKIDVSRYFV